MAQDSNLESILEPLLGMMERSPAVNQALGRSGVFITEIVDRLQQHSSAIVCTNLLKMIRAIYEFHEHPIELILDYNLFPVTQKLSQDQGKVIVSQIATSLLSAFRVSPLF